MSSIVVTIPKSRMADIKKEEEAVKRAQERGEEIGYFWNLGRRPRDMPFRIYFLWDGAVRGYHEVVGYEDEEDRVCTTTGRHYKGFCVDLDPEFHDIKPIPMKPLQRVLARPHWSLWPEPCAIEAWDMRQSTRLYRR